MAERPLHCTIRNPVLLTLADLKSEFHSGCKIIDVSLSNIVNPEPLDPRKQLYDIQEVKQPKSKSSRAKSGDDSTDVGEIHFKNNYVAYLTVKAKCRLSDTKDGNEVRWRTCVKRMRLMPNPHVEAGAQDYFVITRKHMTFDLVNITALRIILQQPSPVWKEFKIEDLKVFRSSESVRPSPLPSWLTDSSDKPGKRKVETEEEETFPLQVLNKETDGMGIGNLEALSSNLQQLWALSEEVAAQQTSKSLGRYEVDGCYEINLLSYS